MKRITTQEKRVKTAKMNKAQMKTLKSMTRQQGKPRVRLQHIAMKLVKRAKEGRCSRKMNQVRIVGEKRKAFKSQQRKMKKLTLSTILCPSIQSYKIETWKANCLRSEQKGSCRRESLSIKTRLNIIMNSTLNGIIQICHTATSLCFPDIAPVTEKVTNS